MVQLGKVQPWSRAVRARRWAGVKSLVLRPRSRISLLVPRSAGMMSASQAILRRVVAATGPVKAKVPAAGVWGVAGVGAAAGKRSWWLMVAMIWGLLPPVVGSWVVVRAVLTAVMMPSSCCWGRVRRSRSGRFFSCVRSGYAISTALPSPVPVPSLGEVAVAGFADKGALGVAECFFGGFGAVGVDGFGEALGKAGEEVGVCGGGGVGEVVFNAMQCFGGGVVL